MVQVIEQSEEEKLAMYMAMPKRHLAEMLVQANKVIDMLYAQRNSAYPLDVFADPVDAPKTILPPDFITLPPDIITSP